MGYATEEQAKLIHEAINKDLTKRIDEMPDVASALRVFTRAYRRLIELGFREIIYHPKDGSTFEVIEPGSTGIFPCQFWEKPERGSFWIMEDGGSPSHPVLWRALTPDRNYLRARKASVTRMLEECPEDDPLGRLSLTNELDRIEAEINGVGKESKHGS